MTTTFSTAVSYNIRLVEETKLNECRNCLHLHYTNFIDQCSGCSCDGKTIYTNPLPCYCNSYAPKDNLEYLEYLYTKKVKENV